MAEMSVASAIVVPELDEEPPNANPLKRRQSETQDGRQQQEQEGKRQRISPGKNSPAERDGVDSVVADSGNGEDERHGAGQVQEARPARRQSSVADEKQRSKRLFGALLGNLNQPGDRASKRRQEIESRRKAELQRQDDERVGDKLRKQEKLDELKRKEQIKVDHQNMRIRHTNMLNEANFLQTLAEPRLFYRPWDLRPDEEDRIEQQTTKAQAQIDKEIDTFERRLPDREHTEPQHVAKNSPSVIERTKSPNPVNGDQRNLSLQAAENPEQKAEEEEQAPAKSDDSKPAEVPESPSEAANRDTNDVNRDPKHVPFPNVVQGNNEEVEDEEGDHVVDGDEDTVIY